MLGRHAAYTSLCVFPRIKHELDGEKGLEGEDHRDHDDGVDDERGHKATSLLPHPQESVSIRYLKHVSNYMDTHLACQHVTVFFLPAGGFVALVRKVPTDQRITCSQLVLCGGLTKNGGILGQLDVVLLAYVNTR